MKKLILGASLFSSLLLVGCSSETVASTTAGKISQDELYEEMKGTYGPVVLQNMLIEDVLDERYGENITQEEVDALVQEDVETLGGEEAFQQYLGSQGLTEEAYGEAARLALLMREAVVEHAGVTEEDLQTFYDEWQPAMTASHILVEDKETAQSIIDQLNDGADFGELVQEHSIDTATVPDNGQMTFASGDMVKEFEDAAMALEKGKVTQEPVETPYGYHVIRMDEKPEKGSYEDEKDTVRELYIDELMADTEAVRAAIGTVAEESNIIIEDDDLTGALQGLLPETEASDSSGETPEKPAEETSEKPAEETSEKPAEETPEKPAEETPEEPAEEAPEEPAEEASSEDSASE